MEELIEIETEAKAEAKIKDIVEFYVVDSDDILYNLKPNGTERSIKQQIIDLKIPEYKIYRCVNGVSEIIGIGNYDKIELYKCKREIIKPGFKILYKVNFENGDIEIHNRFSFYNRYGCEIKIMDKVGEKEKTYSEFYITSITIEGKTK